MFLADLPEIEEFEAVNNVILVFVHEVKYEAELALRQVNGQLDKGGAEIGDLEVSDLPLVKQRPGTFTVIVSPLPQSHEHIGEYLSFCALQLIHLALGLHLSSGIIFTAKAGVSLPKLVLKGGYADDTPLILTVFSVI